MAHPGLVEPRRPSITNPMANIIRQNRNIVRQIDLIMDRQGASALNINDYLFFSYSDSSDDEVDRI